MDRGTARKSRHETGVSCARVLACYAMGTSHRVVVNVSMALSLVAGCSAPIAGGDAGMDARVACGRESEACCAGGACAATLRCDRMGTMTCVRVDAGEGDGGDPCLSAGCTAPTPYCIAGTCVACESASDCSGATPVCDEARGVCVARDANPCSPCNVDADCMGLGVCTRRISATFSERVCLPAPEGTPPVCPPGLTTIDAPAGTCIPFPVLSCTHFALSRATAACVTGADCVPLGAVRELDWYDSFCFMDQCFLPCSNEGSCPENLPTCTSFGCTP